MNMFSSKFYKDFGLSKVPKEYLRKQEVYNLFKKPQKETREDAPRFYNLEENDNHQADVLYLPEDDGYKYCLVVVDVATNKTDAEPMKERSSNAILSAIKKIYNRDILDLPERLTVDSGGEFKKDFIDYFQEQQIAVRKALPGRHRQVAVVERKNQIIGRVLFMRMFSQELLTGETSKEWVDDLPLVVERMNEKYSHEPYTDEELLKKFDPWKNLKQNLIPIGTRVRIALDEPRDIQNAKLIGKFRDTDHRFTKEIYKVVNYIFDPHQPVLYKVDKPLKPNERVAYTAKQLQVVDPDEQDPDPVVIRGQPKQYVIKRLVQKRKLKGKLQYLVHWKGYNDPISYTWEDARNIPKFVLDKFKDV
jgi:hypothetical protein